jgi:ABC-2 type transport system permease protein
MFAEAAAPLISLAIWYTVAQTSESGPTPRDVFTYFIIITFVKIITDSWNGIFLAREILNGDVIKNLIRPLHVFWYGLANNLTEKVFKLILPLVALIVSLNVWPNAFSPAIFEWRNILFFLVSLVLAIAVSFNIDLIIGLMAFWLEDAMQIRRYKVMLEQVASGLLIPFSFLPPLALAIFSYLPFRYITSAPTEILLNQTPGTTVWQLIVWQIIWFIGSAGIIAWQWQAGLRRYAVPGQ